MFHRQVQKWYVLYWSDRHIQHTYQIISDAFITISLRYVHMYHIYEPELELDELETELLTGSLAFGVLLCFSECGLVVELLLLAAAAAAIAAAAATQQGGLIWQHADEHKFGLPCCCCSCCCCCCCWRRLRLFRSCDACQSSKAKLKAWAIVKVADWACN